MIFEKTELRRRWIVPRFRPVAGKSVFGVVVVFSFPTGGGGTNDAGGGIDKYFHLSYKLRATSADYRRGFYIFVSLVCRIVVCARMAGHVRARTPAVFIVVVVVFFLSFLFFPYSAPTAATHTHTHARAAFLLCRDGGGGGGTAAAHTSAGGGGGAVRIVDAAFPPPQRAREAADGRVSLPRPAPPRQDRRPSRRLSRASGPKKKKKKKPLRATVQYRRARCIV